LYPENTSAASRSPASLWTEPEDNTMFSKGIFVIFGPKCIFDASKHSN